MSVQDDVDEPSGTRLDDEIGPHAILYDVENEHAWLQSTVVLNLEVYR